MRVLFFAFLILFSLNASAQKLSYSSLYGKWKVIDVSYFIRIPPEDYETEKNKCLQATCMIDNKGIHISNNDCGFLGCSEIGISRNAKVILTGKYFSAEDEGYFPTDSTVSDKFVSLMGMPYGPNISYFKTKCLVDYGDARLKIFVPNKNRIALYLDWSMIILERKK